MSDVFVTVTVPGKPTPKERPRHGANGNTYTPRGTEEYEQAIGWAGRQAMRGRRPTWERLAVTVDLYGDWAWGNTYGYVIEEPTAWDEDGDATEWGEIPDGSCWGYYGDPEDSGLDEAAWESVPDEPVNTPTPETLIHALREFA